MSKPPKIVIPGLNRGAGIPSGYIVGRLPGSGHGPAQLLDLLSLRQMGIQSRRQNNSLGHEAGFGFTIEGLPTANEYIGTAVWSRPLTFHNGDAANVVVSQVAATANCSFRILDNTLTLVGNINFLAGGSVGAVVWAVDPYTFAAGLAMSLYAPLAADATLANITGRVVGYTS